MFVLLWILGILAGVAFWFGCSIIAGRMNYNALDAKYPSQNGKMDFMDREAILLAMWLGPFAVIFLSLGALRRRLAGSHISIMDRFVTNKPPRRIRLQEAERRAEELQQRVIALEEEFGLPSLDPSKLDSTYWNG